MPFSWFKRKISTKDIKIVPTDLPMSSISSDNQEFHRSAPIIYEPWEKHEHTFFILHGRGDSPTNFSAHLLLAPTTLTSHPTSIKNTFSGLRRTSRLIFLPAVLPAPNSTPLQKRGEWFRIKSLKEPNLNSDGQIPGLREHSAWLGELVRDEIENGVDNEKIGFIGLSQGGAMSLIALLTGLAGTLGEGERLGAVVGMSTWLPFSHILEQASEPETALASLFTALGFEQANQGVELTKTPVFLGHGGADTKVSPELGRTARDLLRRLGFDVKWKEYEGWGHWFKAPDEIDHVLLFLERTMGVSVRDS